MKRGNENQHQSVQRKHHEPPVDKHLMQATSTVQAKNNPFASSQAKPNPFAKQDTVQAKTNSTGMSDDLKTGIESLSGVDMSDVKVHYNSDKPAQLQAHAYAQGTDIHLASGQEKHLPHEAWHVVQQKQGRVQPTMQMKSINVNDDSALEHEADVMGAKAVQMKSARPTAQLRYNVSSPRAVVQRYTKEGRFKVSQNRKYKVTNNGRKLFVLQGNPEPQPIDFFEKAGTKEFTRKEASGDEKEKPNKIKETYDVYEPKADIGKHLLKDGDKTLERLKVDNTEIRIPAEDNREKGGFYGDNDCGHYASALATKNKKWVSKKLELKTDAEGISYYEKVDVAGGANLASFYDATKKTRVGTNDYKPTGYDQDLTNEGHNANPAIGEAYFIYPPQEAEKTENRVNRNDTTNFHVAAVVAKDGSDNITSEANAGDADRTYPHFEMYGTATETEEQKAQTFLGTYWESYSSRAAYKKDKTVDARVARLTTHPSTDEKKE